MPESTTMETRAAPAAQTPAAQAEPADEPSATETFAWHAHPARQRPAQAILAIGIIAIVAGFIVVTVESVGFAILGALILFGALNRFFFPSRFTVDEQGITAAYPMRQTRYRWREIQRFVWDEYGGYLSTRSTPSRLDAYRGMHLLFDEADRERIIARIRERVGKHNATKGDAT